MFISRDVTFNKNATNPETKQPPEVIFCVRPETNDPEPEPVQDAVTGQPCRCSQRERKALNTYGEWVNTSIVQNVVPQSVNEALQNES